MMLRRVALLLLHHAVVSLPEILKPLVRQIANGLGEITEKVGIREIQRRWQFVVIIVPLPIAGKHPRKDWVTRQVVK